MCGPGGGKAGTLLGQTWQRVEAGRGATIIAVPSLHVSDLGTGVPLLQVAGDIILIVCD